ncbi:MAG: hypothetical protein KAT35_05620, partial [Candidatus Aenigmarchaeota archaeon]|nr:hypothetical protein [Candidatus Aenigmarchaeota archaeon]
KLNKIGSYSIEVKAGKAGFKDHTVIKQFAVIEKPANIAPVQTDSNVLQWEMIIVILLSLVSVIIYYFLKRKNSKVLPGITPRG